MASKIKSKIFSFAKLAGFIAACAVASFAVIAPLWLLASKQPGVYSALVLAAAGIFIVFKCVKAAKKAGLKKSLFFALKALAVTAGIYGAAFSLASFSRLLFVVSVLAAAGLFKLICRLEKNGKKRA